ncbi:class I SAM-dependent methyltransferase [Cellulomonas marina]|uniref:Methyltransferase domain-containing protein n=1 Tax=Cellulomonas marina TaxID=988821 RepID=A0A1I1A6L1_9CELL|nr:class I SAM-dependent methyltransferase [Cellulomonas marina]GIG29556.1 hypothetical protein Cma02nite_21560 [Cellulomonas marina]SFB33006.1 Methyltransferase domain-containing protein [Cellulomonas marina]
MDATGPDRRNAEAVALFDRVAGTYDAVGVPWFTPIARALVALAAPRPGQHAVDLGTGRGAALGPLAEAVGPTGTVLGIDLAAGMVAATARDVERRGVHHVRVVQADATDPPVAPGTADVVVASLVLVFLPDPAAAVRRWAALLGPGGTLAVSTFGPRDAAWERLDDVFTPWLPQGLLDARTAGTRGPFATDDGVAGLLADAGLVDVRTEHHAQALDLPDLATWERWTRSHGQRRMWDLVPADERDGVRAAAAARLEDARTPDGGYRLVQDVRLTRGRRAARRSRPASGAASRPAA